MVNTYSNDKPFFVGPSLERSTEEAHLITCDHPKMKELGLFAFTTGTLYDWLHTTRNGVENIDYDILEQAGHDIQADGGSEERRRSFNKSQLEKYDNLKIFLHGYSSMEGVRDYPKAPPQLFFSLQNYVGFVREDEEDGCGIATYAYEGGKWVLQKDGCREGCVSKAPPLTLGDQRILNDGGTLPPRPVFCSEDPNYTDNRKNAESYNGSFKAWRNEGRNGRYYEYKIIDQSKAPLTWEFREGSESYDFDDLKIDELQSIVQLQDSDTYSPTLVGGKNGIKYNRGGLFKNSTTVEREKPLKRLTMNGQPRVKKYLLEISDDPNVSEMDYALEPFINAYADTTDPSYRFIQCLIELNNYVNLLVEDKSRLNQDYDDWSVTDRARYRFINDIKSSGGSNGQRGYFEWKSNIGFIVDVIPEVLTPCVKYETVTFRLNLYDKFRKKDSSRKIAQTDTVLVAPKRTHFGLQYKEKDESGYTATTSNADPNNQTAAELQTSYVPLEGKFESGTSQVFAVVLADLPAAQQPSVDELVAQDEEFLLSPNTGLGPSIGSGLVVSMQNANPMQWMPDFEKTKNCRKEDDEDNNRKIILTIHNITSSSFKRGDNVILQKLDGVWVPLLTSTDQRETLLAPADPKWDFMYLMTNGTYYFRNHHWIYEEAFGPNTSDINWESFTKNSPDTYEKSFYYWYYKNAEAGYFTHVTYPKIINIDDNKGRFSNVEKYAQVVNGYLQVTSWDFMGVNIGGTRRKNEISQIPDLTSKEEDYIINEKVASEEPYVTGINGNHLSCTQFSFNQKGEPFENDGIGDRTNSYPFFGCVFPDGYLGGSEYALLMQDDKDFFLAPKNYKSISTKNHKAQAPFFYATEKKPFENLVDLRNEGYYQNSQLVTHQELGMFAEGEGGTLKHLPADIGTNAAPSGGKNGTPVSNIAAIAALNYTIGADFRNEVGAYFENDVETEQPKRYSWMYKKDKEVDEDRSGFDLEITSDNKLDFDFGYQDSAFDIKPANPLRIEFRPLNIEAYSTFEAFDFNVRTKEFRSLNSDYLASLRGTIINVDPRFTRGEFSLGGYSFNREYLSGKDKMEPLFSPVALFRAIDALKVKPTINNSLIVGDNKLQGLFRESDFTYSDNNDRGLRYNKDLVDFEWNFLPDDITHAPQSYWDETWMQEGVLRPAGAVGVIGAVVTVATRDTLQFATENALGLDNYLEAGGLLAGATYGRSYRDGDYSTLNSTNLFAKVYQQWPREQTIYDPRFFAVHHFNAGVEKSRIENNPLKQDWYLNNVVIEEDSEAFKNAEVAYPSGKFQVDRSETPVDFRIITDHANNAIQDSGDLEESSFVYSDSRQTVINNSSAELPMTSLRDNKEHWRVNPQRRGKLLPYSYQYLTIGINNTAAIKTKIVDHDLMAEGDQPKIINVADTDIVIVNRGSGYNKKDSFEVSGGEGGGVVLSAIFDDDDNISGFKVEQAGLGFGLDDFGLSDQSLRFEFGETPSSATVSIVHRNVESGGAGLVAYVLRGTIVKSSVLTDIKPREALSATGPIKLTPSAPTFNDKVLQTQLTDPKNQSFTVTEKSNNDQYDVFLHFHNDVSHTRYKDYGHSIGPQQMEQMVRLNILTNGSSNTLASNSSEENQGAGGFAPGEGGDQFAGDDWAMNSNNFDAPGGGMFGGAGGGFMGGAGGFGFGR